MAFARFHPLKGSIMRRMLCLLSLLAILASCGQAQSPVGNPIPTNGQVRIATWNLEWFFDDDQSDNKTPLAHKMSAPSKEEYQWRLSHTAEVIAKLQPTVLALQEVENRKVVEDLARELRTKRHLDYHIAFVQGNDTATEQDVAFLVLPTKFRAYRGERDARIAREKDRYNIPSKHLFLDIAFGEGNHQTRLTLVTVHFKSGSDGEDQRQRQARTVRYWLQDEIKAGANLIVLGDFNSSAHVGHDSPASSIGILRGLETKPIDDDFEDLSTQLPTAKDRKTHAGGLELDRIFVSQGLLRKDNRFHFGKIENRRDLVIRGSGVDRARDTIFEIPQAERDVSDHYPLVATFIVNP